MMPFVVSRCDDNHPAWRARWRHHDPTRRAIRAADNYRLAATRLAVVTAITVVGDGGEQKPGGDTDRGAFGRTMVVVLANDGSGDAAEDYIAGGIVAVGVECGGDGNGQTGRAGKREEKAGFHTPT